MASRLFYLSAARRASCFLSADPFGQGYPVRILLGFKLPPSIVDGIAARRRRQRVHQKPTRVGSPGSHQCETTSKFRWDCSSVRRWFQSPASPSERQYGFPHGKQ